MTQLAIKGHATRGNEVIEILEMLGGKIRCDRLAGNEIFNWYYINGNGFIDYMHYSLFYDYDTMVFTLEEFEEKFPYKVGDDVITKSNNVYKIKEMVWNNKAIVYALGNSECTICWYNTAELQPYKEELTMKKKSKLINIEPKLVGNECVRFTIPTDMKLEVKDGMCYLYRDCGEHKENKSLQEHKEYIDNSTPEQLEEEDSKEIGKFTVTDEYVEQCKENMNTNNLCTRCVYAVDNHCGLRGFTNDFNRLYCSAQNADKLPNGFELQPDGYFSWVDSKPQYPKDYEESCKVLGISRHDVEIDLPHPYQQKMFNLFKLYICRDAYWKIAGKELGLDKPWEPDWENNGTEKYCIIVVSGVVSKQNFRSAQFTFAFPTKEMRDAFFENFKDLIEQCKELL